MNNFLRIYLYALFFAFRIFLIIFSAQIGTTSITEILACLGLGLVQDFIIVECVVNPFYLIFSHKYTRKVFWFAFIPLLYILHFILLAEFFFWNEFGARFNFIAVDYLIYTNEVLGNIWESYPIVWLLGGLLVATLTVAYSVRKLIQQKLKTFVFTKRGALASVGMLALVVIVESTSNLSRQHFENNYIDEISKNGSYSFLHAFQNNELDFSVWYPNLPIKDAYKILKKNLGIAHKEEAPEENAIWRKINAGEGPEQQWNVIQITVESLSGDFLGKFGNTDNITPNLDRLADESIFFKNFYSTGNRTDRGMEALTLAVPPTPGRSLVKRPQNADLFSVGSVFRNKNYKTRFLYSGYGYFDNMNTFFSNNGYDVTDRSSFTKEESTFGNVWGLCDEDLLNMVLKKADEDFAAQKKFFYFTMTTSNHRPYTYPEGKIDIPSGTGRDGAVKYTDYAIGQFLEKAKTKPWYKNTIFVIVADHCASSAGRVEIPLRSYHIPFMIHAPGILKPQVVEKFGSQIDYAPSLFGLLNWSYDSQFFGQNLFENNPNYKARIPLGTYQSLGFFNGKDMIVLRPPKETLSYFYETPTSKDKKVPFLNKELKNEAISYYQVASDLYKKKLYKAKKPNP